MDKNSFGASLGGAPHQQISQAMPVDFAGFADVATAAATAARLNAVPAPASPDFKPSHCVNAELLLSTPLTVVVRARLDHVDADGEMTERDLALVIPRSRCEGDQPYWPALLSVAQEHWHRCPGQARRLSALVDGEWQTLLAGDLRH